MKSEQDLTFVHMGNGITVLKEGKKIAHINTFRYVKSNICLSSDELIEIIQYADTQNPTISVTQKDQYVFKKRV